MPKLRPKLENEEFGVICDFVFLLGSCGLPYEGVRGGADCEADGLVCFCPARWASRGEPLVLELVKRVFTGVVPVASGNESMFVA